MPAYGLGRSRRESWVLPGYFHLLDDLPGQTADEFLFGCGERLATFGNEVDVSVKFQDLTRHERNASGIAPGHFEQIINLQVARIVVDGFGQDPFSLTQQSTAQHGLG